MQEINLKQIIEWVYSDRLPHAHLCLDLGCTLTFQDPKPLARIVEDVIEYLQSISNEEIQIDLDAHNNKHQLVFIIHTDKDRLTALPRNTMDAVKQYRGEWCTEFEPRKYFKIQITFKK